MTSKDLLEFADALVERAAAKNEGLIRFMGEQRTESKESRMCLIGLFSKFVESQKKSIWKSASLHFLRLACVV